MFCKECGKEINDKAVICVHCGETTAGKKDTSQSDSAMRILLPVGRSSYAVAAGYLAFFSWVPIIGQLAIICGVLGIREIKSDKEKHGMGRAWFGIILGAIFTIIYIWFILK
ncbi:MAG: DUF4190 domain-containing protein [Ghiorsea sp.]